MLRRPRSVPLHRRAVLVALLLGGCQGDVNSSDALPLLRRELEPYGLVAEVAGTPVTVLGYRAPDESCPLVYRITASYDPPQLHEPDNVSTLTVGHDPKAREVQPPAGQPIPSGEVFEGRVFYRGFRAENTGVSRSWYLSSLHAGPTAPTAGCLPKTWDPVEDAMTLGWPKLTGRLTATDETWSGLRVEGKCNRSACVDPKTGGGGADVHDRTCVTSSWQNEFAGHYVIEGERYALIASTWTDGHGPANSTNNAGVWSERWALISLEYGRPVWAKSVLRFPFGAQAADKQFKAVVRTWVMDAIDECGGSLPSHGWERDTDVRARLAAALEDFANSGDVRRSKKRNAQQP